MMGSSILTGDCIEQMQKIPDQSIHCCVTSPPYWGLRDYGCDGQIGLENTPEAYVNRLVEVFREVRRVLRNDGTLWLNLGDSYATSSKHGSGYGEISATAGVGNSQRGVQARCGRPDNLKPKDLVGIPWRVAFALQADGWWLRQDIIWHKPNPMPESVTDRCTKAHEYVFLLTKSQRYYYDAEAVSEASKYPDQNRKSSQNPEDYKNRMGKSGQIRAVISPSGARTYPTRNRRSVWTITTKPCKESHFATMPPDLVEPCILAGTSEKGSCSVCGAFFKRLTDKIAYTPEIVSDNSRQVDDSRRDKTRKLSGKKYNEQHRSTTTGWSPTCKCDTDVVPCTVLDPFGGAGTTSMVAIKLRRSAVMCELNPEYVEIAKRRIASVR